MSFFKKIAPISENNDDDAQLTGPFKKGENTDAHSVIKQKKELLSFVRSWRVKGMEGKQAEKQLAILTQNVIQAQTDHIKHQLQLGLDKVKKEEYNKYLADIALINSNIVVLSANAAKSLLNITYESALGSYETQQEQIKRFKQMFERGDLEQDDYDTQISKIKDSQNNFRNYVETMVTQIIENNASTFSHTLKLFDETKISF